MMVSMNILGGATCPRLTGILIISQSLLSNRYQTNILFNFYPMARFTALFTRVYRLYIHTRATLHGFIMVKLTLRSNRHVINIVCLQNVKSNNEQLEEEGKKYNQMHHTIFPPRIKTRATSVRWDLGLRVRYRLGRERAVGRGRRVRPSWCCMRIVWSLEGSV